MTRKKYCSRVKYSFRIITEFFNYICRKTWYSGSEYGVDLVYACSLRLYKNLDSMLKLSGMWPPLLHLSDLVRIIKSKLSCLTDVFEEMNPKHNKAARCGYVISLFEVCNPKEAKVIGTFHYSLFIKPKQIIHVWVIRFFFTYLSHIFILMKMFWAARNILFLSYMHCGLSCSIPLNNFDWWDVQILSHPYRFIAPDLKFLVEIHHYEKRNTFNPLATAGFRLESSNCFVAQGSGRQTPN